MRTRGQWLGIVLGVIGAGVWCLPSARAEAPAGAYEVSVTTSVILVDPAGTYREDLGDILINFTINPDPKGKFSGSGSASASQYGVHIGLQFTFSGGVSGGGGGVTRLTLSMKGTGTASYDGSRYPVTFSASEKAEYDRMAGIFRGTAKVKACIKGLGCEGGIAEMNLDVPAGDGVDVGVSVLTDAKGKISGTGTMVLDSGRRYQFAVTGKYTAKKDLTSLTFKPTDASGAKLSATGTAAGSSVTPTKLSGSALGQKIKL